ncbi:MAG: D-Ala-D-Ala carboxypeptidase family metallohydrolase [Gemmatimonadota bacterium]
MTDGEAGSAAAGSEPAGLDEVVERLARIELLLVGSLADEVEGNEPPEEAEGGAASLGSEAAAAASPAAEFERFVDGLGLASFRGSEFTPYWSRTRNGVSNSAPPPELWGNIVPTLAVLQHFRADFGSPVHLLSTFRSREYNRAVGGAKNSQHVRFRAIDFSVSSGTPAQWAKRLRSYRGRRFAIPGTAGTFEFKGGIGVYSGFVHVDTRDVVADW